MKVFAGFLWGAATTTLWFLSFLLGVQEDHAGQAFLSLAIIGSAIALGWLGAMVTDNWSSFK